jgi:type I restriction enzyme S subunit
MSVPFDRVSLGSIMKVDRNGVQPTDIDPDVEYVGLESISSDGRIARGVTVGDAALRSAKHQFTEHHILFGKLRPYLRKVAAPEFSGVCSTDIIPLLPTPAVNKRYLFHWLRTNEIIDQATKASTGANLPRLSPNALLTFEIPIRSLDEQMRIAAILDKADALLRQRQESLYIAERLVQSVFLKLFGDPITNPSGWKISNVQEACELIVDCVNRTAPLSDTPTGYKMIRTTNIKSGRVILENLREVSAETFTAWNRRATPRKGDVLLTREAPVGEVGIIQTDDNLFLGQRIMLYRPAPGVSTSEYLAYAFRSADIQSYFQMHASGSTVKHLPLPVCREVPLRLPPFLLQQRFTEIVNLISAVSEYTAQSAAVSQRLFSSLQQRAFKGELDLSRLAVNQVDEEVRARVSPRPNNNAVRRTMVTLALEAPNAVAPALNELDMTVSKGEQIPWSADYFRYRILGAQPVPFSFSEVMQKAESVFDQPPYEEIKDVILNLLGKDDSQAILTQKFDVNIDANTKETSGRKEIVFGPTA